MSVSVVFRAWMVRAVSFPLKIAHRSLLTFSLQIMCSLSLIFLLNNFQNYNHIWGILVKMSTSG